MKYQIRYTYTSSQHLIDIIDEWCCNDLHGIYSHRWSLLDVGNGSDLGMRLPFLDEPDRDGLLTYQKIKFCPFCGEKLELVVETLEDD